VPFEFDASLGEHGILRAHVARANPICKEIESGADALVIFQGASGYISPTFYPGKQETRRKCRLITIWSCTRTAGSRFATTRHSCAA
jgi:predicted FMN-binding regulatory protein PaiB